jgi:hypothetical protein
MNRTKEQRSDDVSAMPCLQPRLRLRMRRVVLSRACTDYAMQHHGISLAVSTFECPTRTDRAWTPPDLGASAGDPTAARTRVHGDSNLRGHHLYAASIGAFLC